MPMLARLRPLFRPVVDSVRLLTAGARLLPSFLIIGGQRCGTSSLFRYLADHPVIEAPSRKEVHYFDLNFDKGPLWYARHFPLRKRRGHSPMTFEATPYYLFHPLVPSRVARTLASPKFIVLLRNPIDRAFSHYNREVRLKRETRPFEHAIALELEEIPKEEQSLIGQEVEYSRAHQRYSYLSRGVYWNQLERWFGCHDRTRFLIMKSEDFYSDVGFWLSQVCQFLEIETLQLASYPTYQKGSYEPLEPGVRRRLAEFFEEHNRRLIQVVGRDFHWN
jgi:Sulfotransferase domain